MRTKHDVEGHHPTDVTSPLSVVWSFWKEFDLEGIRTQLDEVGMGVAKHQEESSQNRRKLAESTKDFRKSCTDGVSKSVGALLKQYQEEIDRLTKRAKYGESAFLNLYQKLYEAPDPAPALAAAFETASHVAELEALNKKLTQELAEYKAESTQIKNQDLTIRKLEEKVRSLEAQLEDKDAAISEVRQQASAEADAAIVGQMREREEALTAALHEAQASLATVQRLHLSTQNQLFAMQSQSEEVRVGQQTELELASQELERAQERLLLLEQEKDSLKQRLALHKQGDPDTASRSAANGIEEQLRAEASAAREAAIRLRAELVAAHGAAEEAETVWSSRCEGLRAALAAAQDHAAALEHQLAARPTQQQVEELKVQVRVLQAVGYNAWDEGVVSPHGASGDGGQHEAAGGGGSGSLEALLVAKNRRLEHDLTMSRLRLAQLESDADAAAAQIAELEAKLVDRQELIEKLEEHLVAARAVASTAPNSGSPRKLAGLLSGSGMTGSGSDDGGDEDRLGSSGGMGDSSMVRVLCSQRDRFRQRVQELEEELSRARADASAARSALSAAQADNVALVERLRYVHAYATQRNPAASTADPEVGASAEKRYTRMYEEKLNPFKEFQGAQQESQKRSLHVADRAMYILGQLVFGSPAARLFVFAYALALHLLVFLVLMRSTAHASAALYNHHAVVLHETQRHDMAAVLHSAHVAANSTG